MLAHLAASKTYEGAMTIAPSHKGRHHWDVVLATANLVEVSA